ncbi:HAD family hydrolase [Streptomyces sp. NBC_01619]|uniref:HAD family hydrolase n=1 Tax=Streptomyces sp. NBC_01619 TaxID=2975901 RepID=UPI00338F32CB
MQLLALFDLDDTLIDRQGALRAWAHDFAASNGRLADSARMITDMLSARAYPSDFVRIKAALSLHGSPESLWSEYVVGMSSRARCGEGVREGLAAMRAAGWTVGIATNGSADIQRAKLTSAGLADLVVGVCVSDEVRTPKPGRAVFEAAARRCGATLGGGSGGWMVGDNPITDVEGGRGAGLRTIWISAGKQWPEGVDSPDATAACVRGAIKYLLEWGRSFPSPVAS